MVNIRERGSIPGYKGFNLIESLVIGKEKVFFLILIVALIFGVLFVSFKKLKKTILKRRKR